MAIEGSVRTARFVPDRLRVPSDRWFYWCIAVVAGILDVWLLVGWREINPLNLSWLAGDPAQYEVGWEFLRYEHVWRFPVTMLTRLDYPSGVSAANLDIIPLIGVFLRPLSPLLPQNFQYLGLYAVLCFVLQTWFGLRLMSLFSSDRIVTLLGGLFFLLSPILTIRLYGHFPQCSQWIIIACIYYYFRSPPGRGGLARYMVPFLILCTLSAAITPYFALMGNLIAFAALLRARVEETAAGNGIASQSEPRGYYGSRRWLESGWVWAVMIPAGTLCSLAFFGFAEVGNLAGSGYPMFSMNIVSPVDAPERGLILKHIPLMYDGQAYEGYNYLGIGALLLLLIVLARRPELFKRLWSASLLPLVIASAIFTALALSVTVTFANHVLFTIPLPKFFFNLLASFRASGRLFWPVHYLLILAAIVGVLISIRSRTWQRVMLSAALLMQYGDVLPIRNGVAAAAAKQHSDPLISSDWKWLPQHHRHLVILPALQCDGDATPGGFKAWAYFARLVARSNLTLNSAYLGRLSPRTLALDCTWLPNNVLRSGLRADTAYVLDDEFALKVIERPGLLHYCRLVDGFDLCTYNPGMAPQSAHLAAIICPRHVRGSECQPYLRPAPPSKPG